MKQTIYVHVVYDSYTLSLLSHLFSPLPLLPLHLPTPPPTSPSPFPILLLLSLLSHICLYMYVNLFKFLLMICTHGWYIVIQTHNNSDLWSVENIKYSNFILLLYHTHTHTHTHTHAHTHTLTHRLIWYCLCVL